MNNIKELLENKGVIPFRAGTTNGGEYHSSCPGCGDGSPRSREQGPSDRFQIWPEKSDGVVYYCRKCGAHGDCIQFLRDFDGKTYLEACAILGITPAGGKAGAAMIRIPSTPAVPKAVAVPIFHKSDTDPPTVAWMKKASEFAAWCHQQLLTSTEGQQLLASRGLSLDTARRYQIGYNPGENGGDLRRARKAWGLPEIKNSAGKIKALWLPRGLVMAQPGADGSIIHLRIRRRDEDVAAFNSNRPYQVVDGSCHATMVLEPSARAFVVVESGLDAYLCAQEGLGLAGAVTTWNAQAHPDEAACAVLDKSLRILVALDNDAAGAKHSNGWMERFKQARRWPALDHKDPGDAWKAGADIRCWIKSGLPPAVTMMDRADLVCNFEGGATKIQAGAVEAAAVEASADVKKQEQPNQVEELSPDDLAELAGLLVKNPVRVLKSRDGGEVRIQWTPAWRHANQATASRISDLVFKSEAVTLAIHRHPAMVIHSGNLLAGGK